MKRLVIFLFVFIIASIIPVDALGALSPSVSYQTYVKDKGWQRIVSNGAFSGVSGNSVEAVKLKINNLPKNMTGSILYQVNLESSWSTYVKDNAVAGSTVKKKQVEAISIMVTGDLADKFDVFYHVKSSGFGWMAWAKNGQKAGTYGYGYPVEGIEVKIAQKGGIIPSTKNQPKSEYTFHNKKDVHDYEKVIMTPTLPYVQVTSVPKQDTTLTKKLTARSTENYPYGNLFTLNKGLPSNIGIPNTSYTKLPEPKLLSNKITAKGLINGKLEGGKFESYIGSPYAEETLEYNGIQYNFKSQQGVQVDDAGNIYIIYDNDTNNYNTGSFVICFKEQYTRTLQDSKTRVSTSELKRALKAKLVAISGIIPTMHGATLATIGDKAYVLCADIPTGLQTLQELSISGEKLKLTKVAAGTYKDSSGKNIVKGNEMIGKFFKNFTMIDAATGYSMIPYSKNRGAGGWYGYAFYQLKVEGEILVITQVPVLIQDLIGDGDNKYIPSQSITYNPWDQRMYITGDMAWMSFDLGKYIELGNSMLGQYNKIAFNDGGASNANPVKSNIDIDMKQGTLDKHIPFECEQLMFHGKYTYLLINGINQILIMK
ncbi:hypothetical protein [Anaerocolumna chitinilytica]|uniref:Uncharacterized protein n=1 Tax=Anaerocolumna chitinilytica TaxID=1727145 RepID=A0A7I8DQK9_9FIRM|nr:hypothetical protein [Anaerocolumna chitinilytica]BCK00670.1 hypothetical protein bsdcttw_37100 [Anaerocolumna chitinilytica]